jgi:protein-disulfide isomerase
MADALAVPIDEGRDHLRGGPPSAGIALVEYGDYECPYSRAAYRSVERVQRHLGERLCFVFRHCPLREIHPHAQMAAEVAEEAGAQGRFWEMSGLLFHPQEALERDDLRRYGDELGLEVAGVDAALDDGRHRGHIDADLDGALRSGVRGTPTLFIDGALYGGSYAPGELALALATTRSSS